MIHKAPSINILSFVQGFWDSERNKRKLWWEKEKSIFDPLRTSKKGIRSFCSYTFSRSFGRLHSSFVFRLRSTPGWRSLLQPCVLLSFTQTLAKKGKEKKKKSCGMQGQNGARWSYGDVEQCGQTPGRHGISEAISTTGEFYLIIILDGGARWHEAAVACVSSRMPGTWLRLCFQWAFESGNSKKGFGSFLRTLNIICGREWK